MKHVCIALALVLIAIPAIGVELAPLVDWCTNDNAPKWPPNVCKPVWYTIPTHRSQQHYKVDTASIQIDNDGERWVEIYGGYYGRIRHLYSSVYFDTLAFDCHGHYRDMYQNNGSLAALYSQTWFKESPGTTIKAISNLVCQWPKPHHVR